MFPPSHHGEEEVVFWSGRAGLNVFTEVLNYNSVISLGQVRKIPFAELIL